MSTEDDRALHHQSGSGTSSQHLGEDVVARLSALSLDADTGDETEVQEIFGDTIGQGAYSRVQRVEYGDVTLAVKIYNAKIAAHKIEKEANFLNIHGAQCPNIVWLHHGLCSQRMIYLELASRGSLFELLHQIISSKATPGSRQSSRPTRSKTNTTTATAATKTAVHPMLAELNAHRTRIVRDLVYAVHYLHTVAKYAHLDLASKNVLLFEDWTAKLCDFHLALPLDGEDIMDAKGFGTLQWQAPELMKKRGKPLPYRISEKADIYSLGIVIWEVIHGRPAWSDTVESDIKIQVLAGERPPISDSCPQPVAAMLRRCWSMDPDKRPTATELKNWIDTEKEFL